MPSTARYLLSELTLGQNSSLVWIVVGFGILAIHSMKRMSSTIFSRLFSASLLATFAFAHSERTDKTGGHYNRPTGTYHYHNPDNTGPAATQFARHCGHIEPVLYMLKIPVEQVAPSTWMKHFKNNWTIERYPSFQGKQPMGSCSEML